MLPIFRRIAINGLNVKKEVIGYKPTKKKIRGYLWTLVDWWENNDLKNEYKNKI